MDNITIRSIQSEIKMYEHFLSIARHLGIESHIKHFRENIIDLHTRINDIRENEALNSVPCVRDLFFQNGIMFIHHQNQVII